MSCGACASDSSLTICDLEQLWGPECPQDGAYSHIQRLVRNGTGPQHCHLAAGLGQHILVDHNLWRQVVFLVINSALFDLFVVRGPIVGNSLLPPTMQDKSKRKHPLAFSGDILLQAP